jgi:hypothetical protein
MGAERHQAIQDATRWIAWLIEYRAELAARLNNAAYNPDPPRARALDRGRPERKPRLWTAA